MPRAASKVTIFDQNQVLDSNFIVKIPQNNEKVPKLAFGICISHDPPSGSPVVKGLTKINNSTKFRQFWLNQQQTSYID